MAIRFPQETLLIHHESLPCRSLAQSLIEAEESESMRPILNQHQGGSELQGAGGGERVNFEEAFRPADSACGESEPSRRTRQRAERISVREKAQTAMWGSRA